jgi:hypothetical protein
VSFERTSPPHAKVTFRAEGGGTLTASVDGVPIVSGDTVSVGKNVAFTAFPDEGYGTSHWTVNGAVIADTSLAYMLVVGVSNAAPVDVTVLFEISDTSVVVEPPDTSVVVEPPDTSVVEPPDTSDTPYTFAEPLSGILTFGPSPVRSGGEVVIFWAGNKEIGGDLLVFNALGDKVATVKVNGVGKIGAWNTRGVVKGTYLMKGMLKDKDGFKCRVLMLVGVVR